MTDFADFKAQLAEYENRVIGPTDWSDVTVTGFVRQAEEYLNRDLRIDWMIIESVGTLVDYSVALPDDWLKADFIRGPTGLPIDYKSRDEFYKLSDKEATGYYTLIGRRLILGGPPNPLEGLTVTMNYYGQVPVFSDTNSTWLYREFPGLYLNSARIFAKGYAVGEEQTAQVYKALVDEMVGKLNAQHLVSKASGSRVKRTRLRSFG